MGKHERLEQMQDNAQSRIRNRRKRKSKNEKQKDEGMLTNLESGKTKDITEVAETMGQLVEGETDYIRVSEPRVIKYKENQNSGHKSTPDKGDHAMKLDLSKLESSKN